MRIFILLLSILLPCSFFALKSRIDSIVEILSGQVIVNHFGSLEAEQERQYLGSIHPVEYSWWLKAEEEKLSEFFKSEGYHRIRMGITEADKNFKALWINLSPNRRGWPDLNVNVSQALIMILLSLISIGYFSSCAQL